LLIGEFILKYEEKYTSLETHWVKVAQHKHHIAILIAKKLILVEYAKIHYIIKLPSLIKTDLHNYKL